MPTNVNLALTLNVEQAMALAQALKRLHYEAAAAITASESELCRFFEACDLLRAGLAELGISSR